jgi:hypothetical protein
VNWYPAQEERDRIKACKKAVAKELATVEAAVARRAERAKPLAHWHDEFTPVQAGQVGEAETLEIELMISRQHMPWDLYEDKQAVAKGHVKEAFERGMRGLVQRRKQLSLLLQSLEASLAQQAEDERKCKAAQQKHDRLQREMKKLQERKEAEQDTYVTLISDMNRLSDELDEARGSCQATRASCDQEEMVLKNRAEQQKRQQIQERGDLLEELNAIYTGDMAQLERENADLVARSRAAQQAHAKARASKMNLLMGEERDACRQELSDSMAQVKAVLLRTKELEEKIGQRQGEKLRLQGELVKLVKLAEGKKGAAIKNVAEETQVQQDAAEMQVHSADFEWFMRHIQPSLAGPKTDQACQIGEDQDFDVPFPDGGLMVQSYNSSPAQPHHLDQRGAAKDNRRIPTKERRRGARSAVDDGANAQDQIIQATRGRNR